MANLKIKWKGEYIIFTNRHLPRDIHKRLKRLATELNTSIEVVMNATLQYGLSIVESEVFSEKLSSKEGGKENDGSL